VTTYPLYLNGQFETFGKTLAVINPATAEPFAEVAIADRARLAAALEDAHAAFHQWRRLTGKARGAYLHAIADRVDARRDEIARVITLENGKPLAQSLGEVAMTVDHLRWFAEEARRTYGRVVPNRWTGSGTWSSSRPWGSWAPSARGTFPLCSPPGKSRRRWRPGAPWS